MYRNSLTWLIIISGLLAFACQHQSDQQGSRSSDTTTGTSTPEKSVHRDFEDIKASDTLTAITTYSATSYFIYRGQPMGYEYELLKRLADHLGLELEIKIAKNLDNIFDLLLKGRGDMIAYGMTVTLDRKERVAFTKYHTTTRQVLVQQMPENWRQMKRHKIEEQLIRDPLELIGKTVHVRKNSSYYDRLKNLEEEIGGKINIETVPGDMETEELIRKVAEGDIEYTVADKNIAMINKTYLSSIDIATPVSFPQRIAWAVRKNSPELLQVINEWINKMRKKTDYYVIYNKYFKNKKAFRARIKSPFYSKKGGQISKYDPYIQKHAKKIGWDWRLLASQIYQESQFDPHATSWAGAKGLMQMLPSTARDLNIQNLNDPATSILAGTRYLQKLQKRWQSIPDSTERIKFVLASYNVGQGHVADARRLAEKYDKDPNIWAGHVAPYLLQKSNPEFYNDPIVKYGYCRGKEPVAYVKEILKRYKHYQKVIPKEADT